MSTNNELKNVVKFNAEHQEPEKLNDVYTAHFTGFQVITAPHSEAQLCGAIAVKASEEEFPDLAYILGAPAVHVANSTELKDTLLMGLKPLAFASDNESMAAALKEGMRMVRLKADAILNHHYQEGRREQIIDMLDATFTSAVEVASDSQEEVPESETQQPKQPVARASQRQTGKGR